TVETSAGRLSAGVLVGADGVRSAVRAAIGGAAATPTGKVAFRATAPLAAPPPTGGARDAGAGLSREELRRDTWVWLSPNAHLVHYPLRRGDRLNLVAVVAATAAERDADGWD